jgi:translin
MPTKRTKPQSGDLKARVKSLGEDALASFSATHKAREEALRLSREMIRRSAESIRATHRHEFANARALVQEAAKLSAQLERILEKEPGVYFAGFVEDAQKEYAEASLTLAIIEGSPLPDRQALGVGAAPYMNGLAEAMGEMRRYILDALRRGDFSRCEDLLDLMDEAYTILVSMDFPDAVTGGLRRNTDMVRGVLERTRGDLTFALRQEQLERKLERFQEALPKVERRRASKARDSQT